MLKKLLKLSENSWFKNKNRTKVLLHADFHYVSMPFYYFSKFFCACAYNVDKNYLYPATVRNVILSIFSHILLFSLSFISLEVISFYTRTSYFVHIALYLQYMLIFIAVSFTTYYYSDANFELQAHLQEISRCIKNPEDTVKFKSLTKLVLCLEILFYVFMSGLRLFFDPTWHWSRNCLLITAMMYETKLLHASFILQLLVCKLRKWTENVMLLNIDNHESITQILVELNSAFQTILHVFQLIKTVFQIIVSVFCSNSFGNSLAIIIVQCTPNIYEPITIIIL